MFKKIISAFFLFAFISTSFGLLSQSITVSALDCGNSPVFSPEDNKKLQECIKICKKQGLSPIQDAKDRWICGKNIGDKGGLVGVAFDTFKSIAKSTKEISIKVSGAIKNIPGLSEAFEIDQYGLSKIKNYSGLSACKVASLTTVAYGSYALTAGLGYEVVAAKAVINGLKIKKGVANPKYGAYLILSGGALIGIGAIFNSICPYNSDANIDDNTQIASADTSGSSAFSDNLLESNFTDNTNNTFAGFNPTLDSNLLNFANNSTLDTNDSSNEPDTIGWTSISDLYNPQYPKENSLFNPSNLAIVSDDTYYTDGLRDGLSSTDSPFLDFSSWLNFDNIS
jgi:hypothetical protein